MSGGLVGDGIRRGDAKPEGNSRDLLRLSAPSSFLGSGRRPITFPQERRPRKGALSGKEGGERRKPGEDGEDEGGEERCDQRATNPMG